MKATFAMLIIVLSSLMTIRVYGALPNNNENLQDNIDPKQTGKDQKIWTNLLAWFENARRVAQGSLQTLESARDLAFTANKYLCAVENISQTVESVYKTVSDLDKFKIWDIVNIVDTLEINVFEKTDDVLKKQIPDMNRDDSLMNVYRAQVGNNATFTYKELDSLVWVDPSYIIKTQVIARLQGDTGQTKISSGAKKSTAINKGTASHIIASLNQVKNQMDNEAAVIDNNLSQASGDNGSQDLGTQAKLKYENGKNGLIMNIQENVNIRDGIKVVGGLVLNQVMGFDNIASQKMWYLTACKGFSDALQRQQAKINQNTGKSGI